MARRGGEEEDDEHHQNPFLSISCSKASSSKLQFRKEVSRARWDEKMGMGEIVERKGSMWTTTGIIRNGKLYCHVEEIIFLAERGALHLVDSDDVVLSIEYLYKMIAEGNVGCSWAAFEAYRRLKLLGYIVGRHGILWTMKENKPTSLNSQQIISSTDETLDLDMEHRISTLLKAMQIDEIKPTFDVYLPNSTFKKSSPGIPAFLLCVLKVNPPLREELESVEKWCGGIPIKFCIVDHGQPGQIEPRTPFGAAAYSSTVVRLGGPVWLTFENAHRDFLRPVFFWVRDPGLSAPVDHNRFTE